jgi:hypothetical protein
MTPEPNPGTPQSEPAASEKPLYDLVPVDPAPAPASPAPLPIGRVVERAGEPRTVGDASLLKDFDEDTDFDAVPTTLQSPPKTSSPEVTPDLGPAFVKAGLGTPEVIAWVGVGLTIAATIAGGITAASRDRAWYAQCILVAYLTALHAVTGTAAVQSAAAILGTRLGSLPLAAARMFAAVAAFQLVFHLGGPFATWSLYAPVAVLAYIGVVWGLFRWTRDQLILVVSLHGGLWLATYLAAVLWEWAKIKPHV